MAGLLSLAESMPEAVLQEQTALLGEIRDSLQALLRIETERREAEKRMESMAQIIEGAFAPLPQEPWEAWFPNEENYYRSAGKYFIRDEGFDRPADAQETILIQNFEKSAAHKGTSSKRRP